ncbi:hypothetical protein FCM35_KLT06010 [Carex littledalei]|uniref:Uncharacterized protein n=1 Tax=Carex littledalei TaxID=544730 RepID=A0A833V8P5_9POAL|nr:hypothetical protein FCM35_KLT06010 [Carex littledalei]
MARKDRYDSTEQEVDSSHIKSVVPPVINVEEKKVTDEEVDEFFAILKRAQEARNLIRGAKKDNGRKVMRDVWQPRFALEDFQMENTARDDGARRTGAVAEKMFVAPVVPEVTNNVAVPTKLDLNAIPDESM